MKPLTPEQRAKLERLRRERRERDEQQAESENLRAVPIDEACDLLACSSRTLWRAVDAGLLPAPSRVGRKSAWPMHTLLSFRATASRRERARIERDRDERGRYIPANVEPAPEYAHE